MKVKYSVPQETICARPSSNTRRRPSGELGEITGFRGIHAEDYMTDPEGPWTWRLDPKGGPGVVADLGSHIVCMARFLLGPISELSGSAVFRPV